MLPAVTPSVPVPPPDFAGLRSAPELPSTASALHPARMHKVLIDDKLSELHPIASDLQPACMLELLIHVVHGDDQRHA